MRVVALGGLGDVYLVSALFDAYQRRHGPATLVVKSTQTAIVELFGHPYVVDDDATFGMEADAERQRTYSGPDLYPHPCMRRGDVNAWTTLPRPVSQADMYRMLLELPHNVPLSVPTVPDVTPQRGTVGIVRSNTWPDTQPGFFDALKLALERVGWDVWTNDGRPLDELLVHLASREWVIGDQCGLMSVLITGGWPCRKTLATPNIDDVIAPGFIANETFPYAYATTFAGRDFDVEELKVTNDYAAAIARIIDGPNARRLWPHDPAPCLTIHAPLAPGDFLDRLAVLEVKHRRFDPTRRAQIARERDRFLELKRQTPLPNMVEALYDALVTLHDRTFELLARDVPNALAGGQPDHATAIRLNRERVNLIREIDVLCHAPYSCIKDYYEHDA